MFSNPNLLKKKEIDFKYFNKSPFIETKNWKKRYVIKNGTNITIKNNSIIYNYSDEKFNKSNEHNFTNKNKKKRVGVIGLDHHLNVGNNLLKYAIYIKLKELGVDPYIVGYHLNYKRIDFINKTIKIRCIRNFSKIKENDYDILMVNSDQTWCYWNKRFYDIAFLKFAKNWKIPKFVYGASLGLDYWDFSIKDEKIAKILLKDFRGISLREIGSIDLVKKHLGINATFVLDPTLLIDKKYYIDLIKKYEKNFNLDEDYIFTYKLDTMNNMEKFINISKKNFKNKIFDINLNDTDYIEKFLIGIYHSKAVITNSYHSVLFSIIFNKPFVAFLKSSRGNERFKTINYLFNLKERFFSPNKMPDPYLLEKPLNINYTLINYYRNHSISFLKKNLGLT